MAQQLVKEVKEERSIGDLFSELAGETSVLVRQEVALAQTELTRKAVSVGKNVGFLVVGGAIGYAAMLAVLAAVIIGLSAWIPAWISALVVGIVVAIVGFLVVSSALSALKKTDITPHESVESLKEDAQWLKNQVS